MLNEFVDVSVEDCHEHSCQGSFEKKEELHLEQPSHGKQMIEFFEGCHVFYDLVAEYMENLCSGNGWLYFYCKYQFLYYKFVPLGL